MWSVFFFSEKATSLLLAHAIPLSRLSLLLLSSLFFLLLLFPNTADSVAWWGMGTGPREAACSVSVSKGSLLFSSWSERWLWWDTQHRVWWKSLNQHPAVLSCYSWLSMSEWIHLPKTMTDCLWRSLHIKVLNGFKFLLHPPPIPSCPWNWPPIWWKVIIPTKVALTSPHRRVWMWLRTN